MKRATGRQAPSQSAKHSTPATVLRRTDRGTWLSYLSRQVSLHETAAQSCSWARYRYTAIHVGMRMARVGACVVNSAAPKKGCPGALLGQGLELGARVMAFPRRQGSCDLHGSHTEPPGDGIMQIWLHASIRSEWEARERIGDRLTCACVGVVRVPQLRGEGGEQNEARRARSGEAETGWRRLVRGPT